MDAESRSDEELLSAYTTGDESAFEELMHRHEDRIFALALRMTGNRPDALDATQDAFITAFRRAGQFRGESAFGTWLYRIGINACHDLLRKRNRAPEPVEDPIGDRVAPVAGTDNSVAMQLDLSAALASLPADYREAVALHDLGGWPYEEIARITGTKIGTVKSRISRGRRLLAQVLEHRVPSLPSNEVET